MAQFTPRSFLLETKAQGFLRCVSPFSTCNTPRISCHVRYLRCETAANLGCGKVLLVSGDVLLLYGYTAGNSTTVGIRIGTAVVRPCIRRTAVVVDFLMFLILLYQDGIAFFN